MVAWRVGFTARLCLQCCGGFTRILNRDLMTVENLRYFFNLAKAKEQ